MVRAQTSVDQNVDLYNLNITCDSISGSPDKIYQIKEITKAIAALNEDYKIPFSLFVNGYKYQEIADKLNISLTTVITHRKNITEKLGIKSVSGLTIYAVMNGYIEADRIWFTTEDTEVTEFNFIEWNV